MLNEKKAGLPVSVQRHIPRIVAGTDLMAALRQSIEAEGKPAAPAKRRPRRPNAGRQAYCVEGQKNRQAQPGPARGQPPRADRRRPVRP